MRQCHTYGPLDLIPIAWLRHNQEENNLIPTFIWLIFYWLLVVQSDKICSTSQLGNWKKNFCLFSSTSWKWRAYASPKVRIWLIVLIRPELDGFCEYQSNICRSTGMRRISFTGPIMTILLIPWVLFLSLVYSLL